MAMATAEMFSLGIVGLPNVGKSTLFNALARANANVANYPFTTIEPNKGIVDVPDDRLERVAALAEATKVTPETIEFVDIAGLVKGASRGEGLGNKFLSHVREVDAIVHVVRCFADDSVAHVDGSPDPVRDMGVIETELVLADLETVGRRIKKVEPMLKTGDKKYAAELDALRHIEQLLDAGTPLRRAELDGDIARLVSEMFLLTVKPVVIVANVSEQELEVAMLTASGLAAPDRMLPAVLAVMQEAKGDQVVPVSAKLEAQLCELTREEADEYLAELGFSDSALTELIKAGRRALHLVTFYTIKGTETRAWTIPSGTVAPAAAGKIHSDMERGFIKAEVITCDELLSIGSFAMARERGRVRTEGKEYVIQNGDVVLFKFNV